MMAGLYIHIPFCKSRCIYCGFYSTTMSQLAERYVSALCRELSLRRDYLRESIHTIYFGGGTPSQLSPELLDLLFDHIDFSQAVEVTMECNPDDVTPSYAQSLARLPVNRVSMGAQTFDDRRLRFLHRRHNVAEIGAAVRHLRDAGIANISVDLMYGFPGETLSDWRNDIDQALSLDVEHLSAYSLMYEEGSVLYGKLKRGEVREIDEETSRTMFYELSDRLCRAGYEHYEISNFARVGFRSMHNSSYWRRIPYLGVGAAAHSFDGRSRQWNVADIKQYIESIDKGIVPAECEELAEDTAYNDTVMLSLRTMEGIDLGALLSEFGDARLKYCLEQASGYVTDGLVEKIDGHLRLTREGLFVSDMIMSDLMIV